MTVRLVLFPLGGDDFEDEEGYGWDPAPHYEARDPTAVVP